MANAYFRNPEPLPPPPRTVILELSVQQANDLLTIVGGIGSYPDMDPTALVREETTSPIYKALRALRMQSYGTPLSTEQYRYKARGFDTIHFNGRK